VSVPALAANPAALRHRIIRTVVLAEFGVSLERSHTLAVARLVSDWHGQEPLHLPGIRVVRQEGRLIFTRAPAGR
jgi:tRNA(Ile)-lysidine synthase